MAQFKF